MRRSLPSKETLRGHSDSSFRGEGYIQCCVGVRLCDMYSNQELAEIHFMYCKEDGNAALARRLYQERYPQRQCPDRKTFVRLHYHHQVRLDRRFPDRWIGRGGPIAWPPRSPDLNPLDFYLWGHLKSLVYSSPVPDLESLRNRIVACSEDIRNTPGVWDRVRRSMRHRCEMYAPTLYLNSLHYPNNAAHFQADVRRYLDNALRDRRIGRGGPVSWPARSPDLSLVRHFCVGSQEDRRPSGEELEKMTTDNTAAEMKVEARGDDDLGEEGNGMRCRICSL
ncbi:hypothetical protein ANN_11571, partial [Periplaneta americana]